jgi:hypothetical protein
VQPIDCRAKEQRSRSSVRVTKLASLVHGVLPHVAERNLPQSAVAGLMFFLGIMLIFYWPLP